ncbi:MAG: hypothetical protein LJE59_10345 [Chromatiaceae bacterium]|jgi:hypothetical protein|nr:hypothetical protein [Chromatiaceae bacterium]
MPALIRFFVELAILRRGPQDLPASSTLLSLAAVLNVLIGSANGKALFGTVGAALGANLLDLVLTLLMLYLLLQFRGHAARLQQTATAFFGLGALAGLVMLLIRPAAELLGAPQVAMLVDLVLAIWLHVALGSVLRHAIGVPLLAGVIIMLSYTVMAFSVIARVFPPVVTS